MATIEFDELALDGSNYPIWASDIKIFFFFLLAGFQMQLRNPMIGIHQLRTESYILPFFLLRLYIYKDLKHEYMLETIPLNQWKALIECYDQQKELIWHEANYGWIHLRLQDFKLWQNTIMLITTFAPS